jgi:RHS repeat-associated protein
MTASRRRGRTYNGDGLRMTRTIGASAVSYVWDLNASLPVILEDTDGNRYVYGLDLLTRINGTDEEWYLYDGLGSTTGLADDTGTITGTYTYDVFGVVRAHTGDATEWSYTGEQNDLTGVEYLRARFYDAETGRFLSQDPVPLIQRYPYASNNPTNLIDPSGALPCWRICDAVGCALDAMECGMDAFIDGLPDKTLFSYNGSYHVSLQLFVTCTVQYPAACVAAFAAAAVARTMTDLIYGAHAEGTADSQGNTIGGPYEGDAFEHCTWSGLTTLAVGAHKAEKILRRYESRPDSPQPQRNFDFASNKRGRDFASRNQALGPAGVFAYCQFGQ